MSDKSNAENYTLIALKNFQCSISFCNIEFQSSCDFSVLFSATNFHSVNIGVYLIVLQPIKILELFLFLFV